VSTTKALVTMSRTPIPYEVAPVDGLQLIVTVVLDVVGPGLLGSPGLGFVGVGGIACAEGVVKYRGVVYVEVPDELEAATFQR
jgi:hypothetical protein